MSRPLTSPSNLLRRKLCPGSERMESDIEPTPEDSEEAAEGTMLHECQRTGELPESLTGEQESTLNRAKQRKAEAIDAVFQTEPEIEHLERKLFLPVEGTPDVVAIVGRKGLVLDYKFGRLDVTEAKGNLQLACYAVMAALAYNLESVVVGIIQPRAPMDKQLTLAAYDLPALEAAQKEIQQILDAAKEPDAPVIASEDACRYCMAKWKCDAYKAKFSLAKMPEKAVIGQIKDEDLAALLSVVRAAQGDAGKTIVAEARRRAEAGQAGWELSSNGANRELTDAKLAFGEFCKAFPEVQNMADLFLQCGKFSVPKLEELAGSLKGAKKTKYREVFAGIAGHLIEAKEKQASPKYTL